ncbi:ABC-2 family transporter protein [Paenibacillus athensensis]|uniref:ABC transporter permease n=1 Tax=Paenibacillus athensensis TaxID=1967502 RepID=A0A4Y8PS78_9BACL|nr:ABC-2 family transporter protein [Paenibacillus athensensis]MCD1260556.1 ABC-2 family transporter protein [Paenibacillus athensensis]
MSFSLFLRFVQLKMKIRLEYRGAFLLGIGGQIVGYGANYLIVYLLLKQFHSIQGWDWPELALLYSLNLLTYALGASFTFSPMTELESLLLNGQLDRYMVKPLHAFMFLIAEKFNVGYVAHILISGLVMAWSMIQVHIEWSPLKVLYLIALLVSGAFLHAAVLVLIGAWGFLFIRSQYLFSLYFQLKEFISYPLSLYGSIVQLLLTTLVPLGFINYYPGLYLLAKETTPLHEGLGLIAPLIGPAVFALAVVLWSFGLRKYEGVGG